MEDRINDRRDLLYGLNAIADEMGLTVPQTKHLAARGEIPTFKMGRTVCSRRSALANHFAAQEKVAANG